MNRRELARNSILGVCGFAAAALAPEAIAKELIVFKPDKASAPLPEWTGDGRGTWILYTPDGHEIIEYNATGFKDDGPGLLIVDAPSQNVGLNTPCPNHRLNIDRTGWEFLNDPEEDIYS